MTTETINWRSHLDTLLHGAAVYLPADFRKHHILVAVVQRGAREHGAAEGPTPRDTVRLRVNARAHARQSPQKHELVLSEDQVR